MALNLSKSFDCGPSSNDVKSECVEFEPTPGSPVQSPSGVKMSEFPTAQLNSSQPGNASCAKQELQRLCEIFNAWLQPEKHSKEEIISQLVMEQFLLTGHCKDKSALKAKWESNGRNMKNFMESLTDDCMTTPVLVHVCMQGQEALFSENMSLKEVIMRFKEEPSEKYLTGENERPLFLTQDESMDTGDKDKEDGCSGSWKTPKLSDSISAQENQIDSLFIIQKADYSRPEEEDVSCGNPPSSKMPSENTSGSQERPVNQYRPKEVKPESITRPDQLSSELAPIIDPSNQEKPVHEEYQKKVLRGKPYRCEECSKFFRYPCNLLAHQRRHRNERPFVCTVCYKGFYQPSDLRIHNITHTGEKPFTCNTCEKAFSHKTNLQAHERIHTGEKPYKCSVCKNSYRQSSTYHRHLRSHYKKK